MGKGSGNLEQDTNDITKNFENPKRVNRRSGAVANALRVGPSSSEVERAPSTDSDFLPSGLPRVLKPESMKDAPGYTMRDADRMREAREAAGRRPDILADASDERRKAMQDGFYSEDEDRRASRDLGIALRATRQKAEAERRELDLGGARAGAAAARSGFGGGSLTANGSVNISVSEKLNAKVSTSTEGPLFGTVKTVNGRQMQKAE